MGIALIRTLVDAIVYDKIAYIERLIVKIVSACLLFIEAVFVAFLLIVNPNCGTIA